MHWYVNYPESETVFSPMYNVDFSYPAHLHGCLEVSFCVSGTVEVTLEGICHILRAGQGILIPPNRVHSYHTADTSEYHTILFSRDLLPDFSAMFSHKKPLRCTFWMGEPLKQHLLAFYRSDRTLFGGKSLLYRMAETFLQDNGFTEDDAADEDMTMKILSYMQDNLSEELSLQTVAEHLGYNYYYISKRIRQIFSMPFTALLSQYRVAKAKMLLDSGNYTVSQAALASGFGSIRTFNRIFHNLTGLTPSQYLAGPSHLEILPLDVERS